METNDDGAGRFPPAPRLVTNPVRRAFRLQRDQRCWPAALSASAATALPVLIGWLAGDVTAGLLATTGSFTGLYGVGRPYLNRGVHLAVIGVCFAVAVALGDWAAENPWLGVLTVALIAVGAVLLCNAFAVGPGAYLFVLGCAAATSAAPEHLSPWYLGLLVLGGSALGWLAQMAGVLIAPRGPERAAVARSADAVDNYIHAVGSADEATTRHRAALSLYDSWNALVTLQPAGAAHEVRRLRRINYELHSLFAEAMATASRPDATPFDATNLAGRLAAVRGGRADTESDGIENTVVGRPGPIDMLRQAITPDSVPLLAAGRVGIAVLVAGLTGVALELDRSYWAMAAAALMLHQGLDWIRTLQKGIERLLGTQGGLALAAAILAFHPHGLALVLVLGLLQFALVIFTVRSYAISVVFTTGMALVIDSGIGVVDVGALLLARGSETLLGCLVALVVYLVTARLDRSSRLPEAIALTLDAVASTLPYLATESVTTTAARNARRDLHLRATNLLPVYEATVLGVGRQRGLAESMWPAVAAAEQLAYRTSAACWSIERAAAPQESGTILRWTPDELKHSSATLGQLSATFRAGQPPGDGASAVPFMAAEIAVIDRMARSRLH